jgi:aspartate/tyrosine/aromatic aminotransferase
MESLQKVTEEFTEQAHDQYDDFFGHLELSVSTKETDPDTKKFHVNAFRDEEEKPIYFRSVYQAQKDISDEKMDKEYSSMEGIASFNDEIQKNFFGAEHQIVREKRAVTFQVLSCTGALRAGLEFIATFAPTEVLVSNPYPSNHLEVIKKCGLPYSTYPYFDANTMEFDFDGMCNALSAANRGSIVILCAAAHNPTGVDPTTEQWKKIAEIVKSRGLVPFFECSSQGLVSGDFQKDAESIHIFLDEDIQLLVAQSFSKSMGLFGDRVGALHITATTSEIARIVASQLSILIRSLYGIPPINGARIAEKILKNPRYKSEWEEDLKAVATRIKEMRTLLYNELMDLEVEGKHWRQINKQVGLFWYTGFTNTQIEELARDHKLNFIEEGKMNMTCINKKNVKSVAQAIKDVISKESPKQEVSATVAI